MNFGDSHFDQFAFGCEMQSMDDGLMQRICLRNSGGGISSPAHVAVAITEK